MVSVLPALLICTLSVVNAAPPASAQRSGASTVEDSSHRGFLMETNFRARYLSVPSSILDIWFFNESDPGTNPYARPSVRAYAVGGEYVWKRKPANWIFYVEYIGNLMPSGYWDDVEQPPKHDDGDWVAPDGLGAMVVGANYAHEVTAQPWLSFLFGGGLGIGGIFGELTHWSPGTAPANEEEGCLTEAPAYDRKNDCPPDGAKRIPKVIPMADITTSIRFHFGDQATARIDMGLHDMLYVGTAVGAVF